MSDISDDALRALLEVEAKATPASAWSVGVFDQQVGEGDYAFSVGPLHEYTCNTSTKRDEMVERANDDAALMEVVRPIVRPLVEEVLRLRQSLKIANDNARAILRTWGDEDTDNVADPLIALTVIGIGTSAVYEERDALRSALLASENEARLLREELSQSTTMPDYISPPFEPVCVMPVRCKQVEMGPLEAREE